MKTLLKTTFVLLAFGMLVPEANAVFGVRRRTAYRTAVVVGTATHAADSAAMAQSQQAAAAAQQQAIAAQQAQITAQQQALTQQQQAAAAAPAAAPAVAPAAPVAAPPSAAPAGGGKPLPLGSVVSALPPGCVSTPVGGVEYYYGGGNFYRAVFQGDSLVYVTAQPQ